MAMPTRFQTMHVPAVPDHLAPDGSAIRSLLAVRGGSLASCTLPAGAISRAVVHETVEEIWYCLAGAGQLWRAGPADAQVAELAPGTCVTIPLGVRFQFRALGAFVPACASRSCSSATSAPAGAPLASSRTS